MSSDSDTVVAVEATEDMTMWSHDIGSISISIERHQYYLDTIYSRMNDKCILVANYSGIKTMAISINSMAGHCSNLCQ